MCGKAYMHLMVQQYLLCGGAVALSVLVVCGVIGLLLGKAAPGSGEARHEPFPRAGAPELLARATLFLGLSAFMGAFTTVKTLLPQVQPFWADGAMAALDRAIHLGEDPWRLLQPWIDSPIVIRFIEWCYSPIWLAVTSVLPAWMAICCDDLRLRRRFLLTFLLAWIVNGTVLAGLFISGGPAFYEPITGDAARFAPLLAWLGAVGGPFSAAAQQQQLWAVYVASSPTVGAGVSAFPSLHVTMAVLAALGGWSISRTLGRLLTAYAVIILIGSVGLGWHYAIDGYAAIASTIALWWLAGLDRRVS